MTEERPGSRLGYVAINETAAHREAGMHRLLRLPQAQVQWHHCCSASDLETHDFLFAVT